MCPFCDILSKRTPKYLIVDENGELILYMAYKKPEGEDHWGWFLFVKTESRTKTRQIYNCPMCGRKLRSKDSKTRICGIR